MNNEKNKKIKLVRVTSYDFTNIINYDNEIDKNKNKLYHHNFYKDDCNKSNNLDMCYDKYYDDKINVNSIDDSSVDSIDSIDSIDSSGNKNKIYNYKNIIKNNKNNNTNKNRNNNKKFKKI